MRQYGDINFTITTENQHFATAREVHVIFSQPTYTLDMTGDSIIILDDNNLQGKISQTLSQHFSINSNTEMQVTYIDSLGERHDSNIYNVVIEKNLLKKVLPEVVSNG